MVDARQQFLKYMGKRPLFAIWFVFTQDFKHTSYRKMFFVLGGGLLHVGFMLRAVERGDGHRGGPHPAARLWSWSRAVPLRPQRWILHLPPRQHHLRNHRPGVQILWTCLLGVPTKGCQITCQITHISYQHLSKSYVDHYTIAFCGCGLY